MKADRRAHRTRELLQKALIELISERGTIQDIADRANVGRTTFYQHYNSKDDLFISCHEAIVSDFRISPVHPLSWEELLAPEVPESMLLAYQHLEERRTQLYYILQGKNSPLILRQIGDRSAGEIEANLRVIFVEADSLVPRDMLANYLAGAQIALLRGGWKRTDDPTHLRAWQRPFTSYNARLFMMRSG